MSASQNQTFGGQRVNTTKMMQSLHTTLNNWKSLSGAQHDEAEATANEFESSFYKFIDEVREWFQSLDPRPQTLEVFLALPLVAEMMHSLPEPLHLNFETEAELIIEQKIRNNEDNYD